VTIEQQRHPGGMVSGPGGDPKEAVFTRTFEAPRAIVFRAFTDADYLTRWWGPNGYSTIGCSVDLRPGGTFSLVMVSPDGLELPVAGRFEEIVPPERLVYVNTSDAVPASMRPLLRNYGPTALPEMHITITFEAITPGRTRLTMSTRFDWAADLEFVARRGAPHGWDEALQRLADLIETHDAQEPRS
jgi:uncharacterized protein YndB with AHSA1/START domain